MFNDDEDETKVMDASTLAKLLGISESELAKERLEKEVHDEFWSDSCWSEEPQDDMRKSIEAEHFQGRDYESLSNQEKDQFMFIAMGAMLEEMRADRVLN